MSAIYRIFLKGLLALLPIAVTLYLLTWIAGRTEEFFGGLLQSLLPDSLYVPGLGIALMILVVFLAGLLIDNYLAARLWTWMEESLQRVPFIKAIYNPLRDVMNLFARDEGVSKRVVMVDAGGITLLGLVTRDRFAEFPQGTVPPDHLAVFIPYSYAVGGFTILVSKDRVREVAIGPERAMQLAITAWIKAERQGRS